MKRFMLIAGAVCLSLCQLVAQEAGRDERPDSLQGPERRMVEPPDPEKEAKAQTDRLKEALQLTDKQYKKIYKLNLKEQKERLEARSGRPGNGRPMPPDGMRPPGGNGGNFPPQMGEGDFPPRMGMPPSDLEERAEKQRKQAEKRDKKMKKILTDEQYARWKAMKLAQPERFPHQGDKPTGKPDEAR